MVALLMQILGCSAMLSPMLFGQLVRVNAGLLGGHCFETNAKCKWQLELIAAFLPLQQKSKNNCRNYSCSCIIFYLINNYHKSTDFHPPIVCLKIIVHLHTNHSPPVGTNLRLLGCQPAGHISEAMVCQVKTSHIDLAS